jgi:hypothetical protein
MKNGKLYIAVSTEKPWKGKMIFDYNRHQEILHLPIDYPRINQFPEWFTVSNDKKYEFTNFNKKSKTLPSDTELKNGVEMNLEGGQQYYIVVESALRNSN